MITPPPPIWYDGETLKDQRDRAGVNRQMGAFEYSLAHTGRHPLLDKNKPLEALRTVHSFDPCMSCAVH